MPNPEFGVDFDASARAMHQSASKGSLMVHEKARFGAAALGKSSEATMFERNTMLKTLKRKIALVAVAALGAGGLAVIGAPAANAAGLTNAATATFSHAGTTTAVTQVGGAVTGAAANQDVIYVRAGVANTFKLSMAGLTAADDPRLYLASGTSEPTTDAGSIALTKGANVDNLTATAATLTSAAGNDAAADAIVLTVADTSFSDFTFTSGALAAGTYTLFLSDTSNLATNAKNYVIATVTAYSLGAPRTISIDKKLTQIGTLADTTYKYSLKDAAGRSTFLVGDEQIISSMDTVATGVNVMQPPSVNADDANTSDPVEANSTPTLTGSTFAGYTVSLDAASGQGGESATTGVTYGINATIQSGVNAFGSASTTFRRLASTNGLTGTLTLSDKTLATGAAVTTATLAQGDTIATDKYIVTLKDAAGAVVSGVTPAVTVTAGTAGAATAAATSSTQDSEGTADALSSTYTAPGTGTSDTITWSIATGGGNSISTSLAISLITSVAVAANGANLEGSGNGGYLEVTDTADTALDAGNAILQSKLDPANTTKITTDIFLTVTATGAFIPNGVLTVALTGTTPSAQRTASATSITTDASGKGTVDVTVVSPRAGETVVVTITSGSKTIGVATYTFDSTAPTIAEISAGPAQAITQKAGTATPVTVTVADQYGQAVANKRVQLSVVGPSAPTSAPVILTDAKGVASYTVTGTTAVAGQTDIVTVTHYDAGAVTAGADDIVTITYTAGDVAAASMTVEYALDQGTPAYAAQATTAIATAIATATNDAGADLNEDAKHLTPDTNGDWTNTAVYGIANVDAAEDEVVRLRFTVKNAAGAAIGGVKVTVTAPAGGKIVSSATAVVTTVDKYSDSSGYVVVDVFSQKVGDAVFTATAGTATASQTIPYGTSNIGPISARYITLTPATASVAGGNAQLMTATVTDRFGNPVKGATVTFTEVGTGRLTGTPAVTSAAGTSEVDFTTLIGETGSSTVTASMTGYQELNEAGKVGTTTGTKSTPFTDDATAGVASATAALTVTAATATSSPEVTAVKADVKAVSDTVATLSKAVTTIQSSVTELTSSFSAQIKSLSAAIAKISKAIAALSKKIK